MKWLLGLVFLLLLTLWLLLTRADFTSLLIGLPFIGLALWSYKLQTHSETPVRLSALGLLRFTKFFFVESLRGGFDVALRVWQPHIPLMIGFYEYPLRLPAGPMRSFFMYCINLLPGTLCVGLTKRDTFYIHIINNQGNLDQDLASLEQKVADLFAFNLNQEASR